MSIMGNTARDSLVARNVKWAEKENLHPFAIEYARKYANLTQPGLRLISAYETADAQNDHEARREAWDNVIRYMRTLQPRWESSKVA